MSWSSKLRCDAIETMRDFIRRFGGCVVKPEENRASRGVSILKSDALQDAKQLEAAFDFVQLHSQSRDTFLVEEWIEGEEVSAEVILFEPGNPCWFNVVDRIFRYDNGYAMEVGHVNPTRFDQPTRRLIFHAVLAAANALGVDWGPFKCDMKLVPDAPGGSTFRPVILEATARLSGGFDSQGTSPALGRHPCRMLLELATGMPLDLSSPSDLILLQREWHGMYAACCAAFPAPGLFADVPSPGVLCADIDPSDLDYLREVHIVVESGDVVDPYTHCATRPAFAIAVGETWEQAWVNAAMAAGKIGTALEDANT